MQAKNVNFTETSAQEAELRRIMQSAAGRQLIQTLQQNGGNTLAQALAAAKNGNPDAAKQTLTRLLQDKQAAALLEQLQHG